MISISDRQTWSFEPYNNVARQDIETREYKWPEIDGDESISERTAAISSEEKRTRK